jgi:hypothetical protein
MNKYYQRKRRLVIVFKNSAGGGGFLAFGSNVKTILGPKEEKVWTTLA